MKPATSGLPHDRSSALIDNQGNFSQRFEESIDLWAAALLNDDGIIHPINKEGKIVNAKIIVKEDGIFVGGEIIERLCSHWAPSLKFKWNFKGGSKVSKGDILVEISGGKTQLLKFERPILNILGRLSGITYTSNLWIMNSKIPIASTRKTTWGLLDKWAVHMGGALTHRLDRNDALMLKENDLAAQYPRFNSEDRIKLALDNIILEESGSFIILEVRSKKQAIIAAETWNNLRYDKPLTIMLDNLDVLVCDDIINTIHSLNFDINLFFEASGGITLENLSDWENSLVHVISTSSIHRGTKPLDISLLFLEASNE